MILALIDHDRGTVDPLSLQALTLARGLAENAGAPLEAVLVGAEARGAAEELAPYGPSKVHLIEHDALDDYAPEAWAAALAQLGQNGARALVAPGSERGNEVLAHVGALTGQPMAANCTAVEPGDPFKLTRVRWGGSLLEHATLRGSPALLTVVPHAVEAAAVPDAGAPELAPFTPTLEEARLRVKVTRRDEERSGGVTLGNAPVVVGGGRGVGSAEGFQVLDGLAELLGGAVGGSRVATNNGWRPHKDQVGLTGNRIAPDLYIACGISGAIQHMVGCKGAKKILAINTDPEAPMMAKADYAVVGDLHEVVPAIIQEIESSA